VDWGWVGWVFGERCLVADPADEGSGFLGGDPFAELCVRERACELSDQQFGHDHFKRALVVAAAVAGADAIVSKSSAAATLVEAIRAVARNPRTIPRISPQMKADAAARLDPADHAILAMRVAGDSPVEIAATLGVPDTTIAHRIAAIVAKLEPLRSAA
jgi:hypothetical protein